MRMRVDALCARLRRGAGRLDRAFSGLTDGQWARVAYPGPPKWTVRDVLAHLLSAEDGLRRVGQEVAAGRPGAPGGLDYNRLNADDQCRLAGVPPGSLLRRLVDSRKTTISWVATLNDEQLDRVGRHPALGEITLETHINAIYGHSLMHLRDLRPILEEAE